MHCQDDLPRAVPSRLPLRSFNVGLCQRLPSPSGSFVTRSPLLVCDFPHCWPRRFSLPSRHRDKLLFRVPLEFPVRSRPPQGSLSGVPGPLRSCARSSHARCGEQSSAFLLSALRGPALCVPPGRAPLWAPGRWPPAAGDTVHAPGMVCRGFTKPWEDDAMFSGPFALRGEMYFVSSTWVRSSGCPGGQRTSQTWHPPSKFTL